MLEMRRAQVQLHGETVDRIHRSRADYLKDFAKMPVPNRIRQKAIRRWLRKRGPKRTSPTRDCFGRLLWSTLCRRIPDAGWALSASVAAPKAGVERCLEVVSGIYHRVQCRVNSPMMN